MHRPSDIIAAVCDVMDLPERVVLGRRRSYRVALARHIAAYLMRQHCRMGLTEIARQLNRRDHTTAFHAIRRIKSGIDKEPGVDVLIREICGQLVNSERGKGRHE